MGFCRVGLIIGRLEELGPSMRSADIVIFKNRYHHSLPCFALLWLALEDDERMASGSGSHFLSLIICINYMIESVQKEPRSRLDEGSIAGREDRSR